jgi:DnaJ-class molecular chaperone
MTTKIKIYGNVKYDCELRETDDCPFASMHKGAFDDYTSPIGCNDCTENKDNTDFRNNFWFWYPLRKYVVDVLSDEQISCGYRNQGFLISSSQARKIADKLKVELESGRTAQYVEDYKKTMDALPDGQCHTCHGTGLIKHQFDEKMQTCPTCDGKKISRPWETHPFTVENVCDFQRLCEHCQGFSLW